MKRAILLVAYGVSNASGQVALNSFDAQTRAAFPGTPVRWAYTSLLLRERLARARKKTDSVRKALLRLVFERFTHVAVQPLQAIPGHEHDAVCEAVAEVRASHGLQCHVGAPMLDSDDDVAETAQAIMRHLPQGRLPGESVVCMGHGSFHAADGRYARLAEAVRRLDGQVHIGAMEGGSPLSGILPALAPGRVWLMPLLSVVGRHALHDMAGPHPQSWKSQIEASGHPCEAVLRGTAEYAAFAAIWLKHLGNACGLLCGEEPQNL